MPVTSVEKNLDALTLEIVADFTVPLQRLWDAYADPRQIERFWGPPTYPARFHQHDCFVGGRSFYTMTGPDGVTHAGFWEFLAITPPSRFEILEGFANADGTPNFDMPTTRMAFAFTATEGGSRLTMTTHFDSAADYDRLLEMGMDEGTRAAMSQIDDVLADLRAFAADLPASATMLDEKTIRICRIVRGTPERVWDAYFTPELARRWMLGPDGWSMSVCETSTEVGGTYRYVWENEADGTSFGSTGEILDIAAPYRARFSERMAGEVVPDEVVEGICELTLTAVDGGTLLSMVITYPDTASRDAMLASGMVDGMESSFQRLEKIVDAGV